jgi:hypothetical protein
VRPGHEGASAASARSLNPSPVFCGRPAAAAEKPLDSGIVE